MLVGGRIKVTFILASWLASTVACLILLLFPILTPAVNTDYTKLVEYLSIDSSLL